MIEKIFHKKKLFALIVRGHYIKKRGVNFFTSKELTNYKSFSYNELAIEIILKFCKNEFNKEDIKEIINKSYKDFRVKNVVEIKKIGNF